MTQAPTQLVDCQSAVMQAMVPMSVVLPPGFQNDGGALHLVRWADHVGASMPRRRDPLRATATDEAAMQRAYAQLPPTTETNKTTKPNK